MHMLKDENGNIIPHGEGHDHHHDHDHHDHAETDALIGYMVSHNAHHAEELKDIAHTLRHEGRGEIADCIEAAVADFATGNEKLSKALEMIKGGQTYIYPGRKHFGCAFSLYEIPCLRNLMREPASASALDEVST